MCSPDIHHRGNFRVTVFTPSGVQIGLCGVGEGEKTLTFPAHFVIDDNVRNLPACHWIRFATPEELQDDPTWYRPAPFTPKCFVYEDGTLHVLGQPMGLRGRTVTAMQDVPRDRIQREDVPCANVDDIGTPPTPPPPHYR